MTRAVISIFLLAIALVSILKSDSLIHDQFQGFFNRSDLVCNPGCRNETDCCVCHSKLRYKNVHNLAIHHVGNQSFLEISDNRHTIEDINGEYQMYSVYYQFQNLTVLPVNLCRFARLLTIDFRFNEITEIDSISCVLYLDTLILRGNKIGYFKNRTFLTLKYIRFIDLSYNNLKMLEPGFLLNVAGNLFHFDVSHNELETIDITNVLWTKQEYFCTVDFSHNKIKTVTNQLHWQFKLNTNFGHGGYVDCSHNELTDFSFFSKIGLNEIVLRNISVLGRLFDYGFDLRDNKWNCDCAFSSFAMAATMVVSKINRTYFDVKCFSPPNLRNKSILQIIENEQFDLFICNISVAQKCPPRCRCFYQPSWNDRTVVNCSSTKYIRFPTQLPEKEYLEVDFTNNSISDLKLNGENKNPSSSFRRIVTLTLKNNNIKTIPDELPYLLKNARKIDLSGNKINKIPRSFQILKPCRVNIGLVYMDCKCKDSWLQEWLPSEGRRCGENVQILCNMNGKDVPIKQLSKQQLGCITRHVYLQWTAYLIGAVVLLCCLTISIFFSFRCEFYIIMRNSIKRFKTVKHLSLTDYDVYVSCNEEDESVRIWLTSFLVPFLEDQNLKVFLPFRDVRFGIVRQEEIIDKISASRNVIIILTGEDHKILVWNQMEWKQAWAWYKSDLGREIVIVNFDMLKSSEISQRYIRAFLRLKKVIDFSNQKHDIGGKVLAMLNVEMIPILKKSKLRSSKTNI